MIPRWKLIAAGAPAAVILAAALAIAGYRAAALHARAEARAAAARAEAYAAAARLETRARAIGEARDRNTAIALATADEAQHDLAAAPDLYAALDRWRSGLERVRASGAAPVADDHPDGGRPHAGGQPADPTNPAP